MKMSDEQDNFDYDQQDEILARMYEKNEELRREIIITQDRLITAIKRRLGNE